MRPIRFRPYWTAEGPLVAAIWHRDEFPGALFEGTEAEVLTHEKAMRGNGWIPVDVAGYPDKSGAPRYVLASVRRPLKDKEEFRVILNLLDGKQAAPANENGMSMTTIHTWRHADEKPYSDIVFTKPPKFWYLQGGSIGWNLKGVTDSKGLAGDLAIYGHNEGAHYVSWVERLEGVTETLGSNKSHAETVTDWQKLAADGFRPALIAAAHDKQGKYWSWWAWRKPK